MNVLAINPCDELAEREAAGLLSPPTILSDTREIDGLYFNDANGSRYTRYAGYVIEAYAEDGAVSPVPFYRVSQGGRVIARVPAHHVEVHYVVT